MENSTLDYIAQACMDLTDALSSSDNAGEKDALIANHIKKVYSSSTQVEDFKRSKFFYIKC